MSISQIAEVPKNIETLIGNIANVIKVAKKGETIMCNVDIEDCLVKGKTNRGDINIDEGVLGVLELIKKEAEKKGVNFIMNFNSVADFNNLYVENKELLEGLYCLNQNKTINRITIDGSKGVSKSAKHPYDGCSTVVEEFIFARPSDDDDGYENKKNPIDYNYILEKSKLKKNIVNGLYLEDFRQKIKNQNKVYVLHFDNEVSYFKAENNYSDKEYQFLPVPIKCAIYEYIDHKNNTQNGHQQNTEGAFLSTDVLAGLEKIFPQTDRRQNYARRTANIDRIIRSHQEQERLEKQRLKEEEEELLSIKKQIIGMISECNLDPDYQTDYEFAKELLINECKETIAMCQEAIDRNKEGLKNIDNDYPKVKQRNYTKKELNDKIKILEQNRLKDIEENKKNHEKQIQKNERYIEEKNKEIGQIKNIKSTTKKSGASDKYLKKAILYLHGYINGDQYEATYRLDKYDVLINVNQNYNKDLMVSKLDTNTIKQYNKKYSFKTRITPAKSTRNKLFKTDR